MLNFIGSVGTTTRTHQTFRIRRILTTITSPALIPPVTLWDLRLRLPMPTRRLTQITRSLHDAFLYPVPCPLVPPIPAYNMGPNQIGPNAMAVNNTTWYNQNEITYRPASNQLSALPAGVGPPAAHPSRTQFGPNVYPGYDGMGSYAFDSGLSAIGNGNYCNIAGTSVIPNFAPPNLPNAPLGWTPDLPALKAYITILRFYSITVHLVDELLRLDRNQTSLRSFRRMEMSIAYRRMKTGVVKIVYDLCRLLLPLLYYYHSIIKMAPEYFHIYASNTRFIKKHRRGERRCRGCQMY